ncbi:response regulator [uncultured Algoriphagus sp.]|uniref:hybrid sensor histidine kinase/response regulator n=1 Tax=uncultured Algoriphagus sp. TaxID=417365 RepID=UPI0025952538|nr:response regulator [uncultured Algoriphagus sp.]
MKKTILLVEDELELQQNYKEILEFNKFTVLTADNGKEALEQLMDSNVDLIISDILMPLMDGISLLKEVRSQKSLENTPFIFLTAKVSNGDIRLGMNMGADDYLTKPVSGQMLLNSVFNNIRKQEIRERWIHEKLEKALEDNRKITFHEFRTPLYGVLSVFDLMESSLKNFDPKEFYEMIQLGKQTANRINQSLEKLSLYYKLEKLNIEPVPNHINSVISEVKSNFNDYELEINYSSEGSIILFDKYLLHFLLGEIIDNAIKFSSPSSPIEIDVNKKLVVKNHQTLSKKQGPLKPMPFNQTDRSENEQQGFGLGLYLCQEICKRNNADFGAYIDVNGNFIVSISFTPFKQD